MRKYLMSFILSTPLEACGSSQKDERSDAPEKSSVSDSSTVFLFLRRHGRSAHVPCSGAGAVQYLVHDCCHCDGQSPCPLLHVLCWGAERGWASCGRWLGQESEPGLAARGRGHLHVRLCASPVFCSSASHLVLTFGGQAYTDFVCAACPRVCARRAPVWCGEGCRLFVPPGLAWCYGDADASPFAREHEYLTNSGPLLGVALREDGSGYGDVSGAHLDGPPEIHGTFGPSVP